MEEAYKFHGKCGCGYIAKPKARWHRAVLSDEHMFEMQWMIEQHRHGKHCDRVEDLTTRDIWCYFNGTLPSVASS